MQACRSSEWGGTRCAAKCNGATAGTFMNSAGWEPQPKRQPGGYLRMVVYLKRSMRRKIPSVRPDLSLARRHRSPRTGHMSSRMSRSALSVLAMRY